MAAGKSLQRRANNQGVGRGKTTEGMSKIIHIVRALKSSSYAQKKQILKRSNFPRANIVFTMSTNSMDAVYKHICDKITPKTLIACVPDRDSVTQA